MDRYAIGNFIMEQRKKKKLTQLQLAQKLNVSEKTISKWECGRGLPDPSLIMPLCKELDIDANELLTGKKLSEDYKENAEENLLTLLQEKQESKRKIILSSLVGLLVALPCLILIGIVGFVDMPDVWRYIIIVIGIVIILSACFVAGYIENDAGYFECKHCKTRFKPSYKAYILGPHSLTTRQLKCPHCGKVSFCKKRLTK
ncbi:MAG: helix-turn-helix domain-containing protein [Clostridia bacterium]|nr:helix-turn-helix domain-containing protein [Clostridia bacterium]